MTMTIQESNDDASERYPSVTITRAHRLHVYEQGGYWCVWLNTEASDFDGLCLSVDEPTRAHAVAEAARVLQAALDALR